MRLVGRLSDQIERGITNAHDWHYFTVPGVTFAATSAAWLVMRFFPQVTSSLAIPFLVFLAASFWWGNLYSALVGAAVISAYTIIETGFDFWRGGQLVFAAVLGAFLIAAIKESLIRKIIEAERGHRAVQLASEADKSLDRLKGIHKRVSQVVQGWPVMAEADRFNFMVAHRGELANLLQVYDGFHQLYLEMETVKWENLQKIQAKDHQVESYVEELKKKADDEK
jgi:hypothetical protein